MWIVQDYKEEAHDNQLSLLLNPIDVGVERRQECNIFNYPMINLKVKIIRIFNKFLKQKSLVHIFPLLKKSM